MKDDDTPRVVDQIAVIVLAILLVAACGVTGWLLADQLVRRP